MDESNTENMEDVYDEGYEDNDYEGSTNSGLLESMNIPPKSGLFAVGLTPFGSDLENRPAEVDRKKRQTNEGDFARSGATANINKVKQIFNEALDAAKEMMDKLRGTMSSGRNVSP